MASEIQDMHDILYGYGVPNLVEVVTLRQDEEALTSEKIRLLKRLNEVEDRLLRTQAALSPARRVPFEILGEIFAHTVDVDGTCEYAEALIDLVLVCKAWRHAAIAAGRLWTHAHIVLPNEGRPVDVTCWLGRAKGLPTSLEVRRRSHTGPFGDEVCACTSETPGKCQLLDKGLTNVLTGGPALSELKLTLSSPACLRRLLARAAKSGSPWTRLQSLEINFPREYTWKTCRKARTPSKSTFLLLPEVASLALRFNCDRPVSGSESLKYPLHIPPPVLDALTSFTLTCSWSGPQVVQVLQHCQNLEILALDIFKSHQTWNVDDPDIDVPTLTDPGYITLPKIRNFSIAYTCTRTALRLLGWLRMPRLEELKVNWRRSQCAICDVVHPLENVRLKATLEALDVLDSSRLLVLKIGAWSESGPKQWTNYEDLNDVLGRLPGLIHLAIDADFSASVFLKLQPKGYAAVAPCLEHLEVTNIEPNGFGLQAVLDWVKARQRYVNRRGKIKLEGVRDSLRRLTLHAKGDRMKTSEWGFRLEKALADDGTIKQLREGFEVVVEKIIHGPEAPDSEDDDAGD